MRHPLDRARLERLLERLGASARGPGGLYLTGGATAISYGWRARTVAVDLRLDPEPPGIFEAIATLKDELEVNVELASPLDFLPEVPGWRERCVFVGRYGPIDVFHFDPVSQVLSKLARGYDRDLADAEAMVTEGLATREAVAAGFEAIAANLSRFPRLDPAGYAQRVSAFTGIPC